MDIQDPHSLNFTDQIPQIKDYLSESGRSIGRVAGAAAVLGGEFSSVFIAKILKMAERGVRIQLNRLIKDGVIEHTRGKSAYQFKSSKLQKAYYNGLPEEKRLDWHKIIVKLIQKSGGVSTARHVELLAFHGLRGEMGGAVDWVKRAIRINIDMGQDERAVNLMNELEQTLHLEKVFILPVLRARMLSEQGKYDTAYQLLKSAVTAQCRKGMPVPIDIFLDLVVAKWLKQPIYPVFQVIRNVLSTHRNIPNDVEMQCSAFVSEMALEHGAVSIAADWLMRGSKLAISGEQWRPGVSLLQAKGKHYLWTGNIDASLETFRQSLEINRRGNSRSAIAMDLLVIGRLHFLSGDLKRAFRTLSLSESILKAVDRSHYLFKVRMERIQLQMQLGEISQSEAELIQLEREFVDKTGDAGLESAICRAKLRVRQGLGKQAFKLLLPILEANNEVSPVMMRKAIAVLPDTGDEELEHKCELIRSAQTVINTFWGPAHPDPLPEIILGRLNPRPLQPDRYYPQLLSRASGWGDPLALAHCLILGFEWGVPCVHLEYESFDTLVRCLEYTGHLDLMADLIFYRTEERYQTDEGNHSSTRYVEGFIRAREIAIRLKDETRVVRSQNRLGAFITSDIFAFPAESSPDKLLLDAVLAIQSVKSINKLGEMLASATSELFHCSQGEIWAFKASRKSCTVRWGARLPLPIQRKIHREIELIARTPKPITTVQNACILVLLTTSFTPIGVMVLGGFRNISTQMNKQVEFRLNALGRTTGLILSNLQREEVILEENRRLRLALDRQNSLSGFVGCSPAVEGIRETVEVIKNSPTTVYIHGETGVGKEVVARMIHRTGNRRKNPFVAYNCAASPEHLVESELFGHKKGAFTGAIQTRQGVFQAAAGGTLFLDEVTELSLSAQAKLLRVLQERSVRPVGADHDIPLDVRVISATNKNVMSEVKDGRFRDDLLYRLMVLELYIPPLRDRREDIPLLIRQFLNDICHRFKRPVPDLTKKAMEALLKYDWPGNVRELRNVLEVGVNLIGKSKQISLDVIEPKLKDFHPEVPETLAQVMERQERLQICRALNFSNNNITRAATILGISRQGLFKKMRKYSILLSG